MKLHLGCGQRYIDGYIHIDVNNFDHIDYNIPIDNLSIFENDSADIIYASHVLEYFDREEVLKVLQEWKRVLKKGGILRVAVPDFNGLLEVYKKTKDLDKILGPLYGKWNIDNDKFIYHKTVYDFNSLSEVLKKVGFKSISLWDWKEVFKDNLSFDDHSQAYFPHMEKENGIHVSLNIECKN